MNEADYFIRMWNQAAFAMDAYQAETVANTLFEPIPPMTPIVIPGVGETTVGAALGQVAAQAPGAAAREASIAHVGAQATVESAGLQTGRAAAQANQMATTAEGQAQKAQNAQQFGQQDQMQQGAQQGVQLGMQMASQLGSTLGQLPQQASQMVMQPMQQLTQPLQQVTSMFSQMGLGGDKSAQMGLIGASPLSNHPLAGGSGVGAGAGLVRAASLPGAGGTAARTPLMSKLVGAEIEPTVSPVSVAAGAAAGATAAGLAPVGSGGGAGPMGGWATGEERRFQAGADGTERAAVDLADDEKKRTGSRPTQTSRPKGRKEAPLDGEDTQKRRKLFSMAQMNTDAAVLAKEAANFERISGELKGVIAHVESTAGALAGQWHGQAGTAAQAALMRFHEAAARQVQELNDISANIHTSGVQYTSTDEDQPSR